MNTMANWVKTTPYGDYKDLLQNHKQTTGLYFDVENKTVLVRVDVNSPVDPGSGLILDNNSHVGSNFLLKSNNLYSGNPVSLTKANVFFIENYVGNFTKDETNMFNDYKSNVFLYSNTPNETLDLVRIDELLSNFSINEKINFIQKLFIQNKKHNRFSM